MKLKSKLALPVFCFLAIACSDGNNVTEIGPTSNGESSFKITGAVDVDEEFVQGSNGHTTCNIDDDGNIEIHAQELEINDGGEAILNAARLISIKDHTKAYKDLTSIEIDNSSVIPSKLKISELDEAVSAYISERHFLLPDNESCSINYEAEGGELIGTIRCDRLVEVDKDLNFLTEEISMVGEFLCDRRLFKDLPE